MPEKGEKTIIPRRKAGESEKDFQARTKAVKPTENFDDFTPEPIDIVTVENTPIVTDNLPAMKTEVKPVTIAGKSVPISASGKARLLNTRTNKIITGFIDFKLAEQQVKDHKHIEIINEEEYRRNNPGK
jgi:hypothetical protein